VKNAEERQAFRLIICTTPLYTQPGSSELGWEGKYHCFWGPNLYGNPICACKHFFSSL